jgi:hypothetical protein
MKVKFITPVLVLVLLFLAGISRAAPLAALDVSRYVIGGGGGYVEQSPYALNGTIGQPLVGTSSQSSDELCAGFWCGAAGHDHEVYLPLVLRNN